mmetsp:Transcript_2863/g.8023  ORF Transcript_2863/g.8023 Transcript_2863/m.8023 type:complete len:242 (-) Transcript_2863:581-1306(-)
MRPGPPESLLTTGEVTEGSEAVRWKGTPKLIGVPAFEVGFLPHPPRLLAGLLGPGEAGTVRPVGSDGGSQGISPASISAELRAPTGEAPLLLGAFEASAIPGGREGTADEAALGGPGAPPPSLGGGGGGREEAEPEDVRRRGAPPSTPDVPGPVRHEGESGAAPGRGSHWEPSLPGPPRPKVGAPKPSRPNGGRPSLTPAGEKPLPRPLSGRKGGPDGVLLLRPGPEAGPGPAGPPLPAPK